MNLTEKEARTKWCPFVRTQNFEPREADNPAINRTTGDLCCIASECMGWRWSESTPTIVERKLAGYCGAFGSRAATASGDQGAATASGDQGAAMASGARGAAMASGVRGCVKGASGCAFFLVNRDPYSGEIRHAWAGIVGRNGIKPDVWYQLDDYGNPQEMEGARA